MVGADAGGCQFQSLTLFGGDLCDQCVDLCFGKGQRIRGQLQAIKALRVFQQSFVAARTDVRNDLCHDMIHIGAVLALGTEQRGELGFEIGVTGGQEYGHGLRLLRLRAQT